MEKKVCLILLFMLVVSFMSFISLTAQISECSLGDRNCKVNNAYICLEDKVRDCNTISSAEDRLFSLLAFGRCEQQILNKVNLSSVISENYATANYENNLKYTSLAILGLSGDRDTSSAEAWLLSQNTTYDGLNWYLQIETNNAANCNIDYSIDNGASYVVYPIIIGDDKTINQDAGSCLTRAAGNYWLEVSSSCYGDEFKISCDDNFATSLLYKKTGTDILYVSEITGTGAAGQSTTEKVNSLCFQQGGSCNYEGSLWASWALDAQGESVLPFLPYLITNKDSNPSLLPEAFLYHLIGNYESELLGKQQDNKFWELSTDRYYDTSLALLPFKSDTITEKTNSENWLLLNTVQLNNGCWNDGSIIKDTAFVLYSVFPERFVSPGDGTTTPPPENDSTTGPVDCEDAGFYCSSSYSCSQTDGEVLSPDSYDCGTGFVCCTEQLTLETCSEKGGEICNSNQNCVRGGTVTASDLSSEQLCCLGSCTARQTTGSGDNGDTGGTGGEENECEIAGGTCRISSCSADEEQSFEQCDYSSDVCCVSKTAGKVNVFWIVALSVSVLLLLIGIIFRDRLRILFFRLGGGGDYSHSRGGGPPRGFPPGPFAPPRRMLPPPHQRPHPGVHPSQRGEISEVLQRLKEMGK